MSTISNALAVRNNASDRELTASIDYAKKLSASELLPKAYVGKPQNVLLAIEFGRSLGLDPITAINMTHIVQGRPTASAQLVGALVRRAGHILRVTGDDTQAKAQIIRSDDQGFTFEASWDMEKARTAGVLSNNVWKNYPAAMLKARAVTECARDACPEVLAGISYTAEEVGGPAEVIQQQTTEPPFDVDTDTGEIHDAEIVEEPTNA